MLFKRIKINNIRSYEDAEITFPSGKVLLSGDIGSGKTSILIAIEFALFGLQPGQKGASLLKNSVDSGFVELEFEIDNEIVIIKRTLKRKKSITQDSAYLTVNGKTEERSTTEIKSFVLEKLNYPLEFSKKTNLLYRFTVYTPQEQMKQIILEDPESRLNTLRHVFGIDKYKRIKENTSILTSKLRELSRLKQGQLADVETLKLSLEERRNSLEKIKSQIPILQKELSEILEIKKQKELEVDDIKSKIEGKNKLQYEVEKTNILLMTKKDQISKLSSEIIRLETKFKEQVKNFSEEEYNSVIKSISYKKDSKEVILEEITNISNKISSINSKKIDLESLKNKITNLRQCPTCLQYVEDNHKHSILDKTQKEIRSLNEEFQEIDKNKLDKQKSLEEIQNEITSLEESKNSLQELKIRFLSLEEDKNKLDENKKSRTSLESDVNMLDQQVTRLKNSISELKKYDAVFESKQAEFAEINAKEKRCEIKKAEITKEIELSEKEILNVEKELQEKDKIKLELMNITELENWFSNEFLELIGYIERNVMIKLRGEFSRLFNDWFSILVPESFEVRLDESFTPIIEQQEFELDYNFLSGGERTAIALAYRLALNQTINSLLSEIKTKGIVILDEPTEGFSQQQLDKMRDVLNQLEVNQLILVSHDQKIESFVDSMIKLDKSDGSTKVVD